MPDKLFFLYGAFIEKDKNFGYGDERAMTIRVAHFPVKCPKNFLQ